mgnify:FL=1
MKSFALILALAGIILLYVDFKLQPIIKYKYIPRPLSEQDPPINGYKALFDDDSIWLENYKSKIM